MTEPLVSVSYTVKELVERIDVKMDKFGERLTTIEETLASAKVLTNYRKWAVGLVTGFVFNLTFAVLYLVQVVHH